jgi:putative glutathione S-transferase
LRDIYFQVDPEYKGRFTVPTLYDVKQGKIVSNESSEIIRMFYTEVCVLKPLGVGTWLMNFSSTI